jgi:hypothetical protein
VLRCTDPAASAIHHKKIERIIGGAVGGFLAIFAAGIVWYFRTRGYIRKKSTRDPRVPYSVEPLRVDNVTSWVSTETNQPLVSQGDHGRPIVEPNVFLTPGTSASQVCLTPAIVMPAINMLTLTSETDLRNETASFRAQTGRQSYEPHGPVPMGSQVFIAASSVTHDKYADAYLRG